MEIIKVVILAFTGVLTALLVRTINKEISIYIILATVILLFFMIANKLTDIFIFLQSTYENITYGKEFFPIMIKVLAIAYTADFTAQLCKDAGENAIASKVEMAGKIMIFYIAIPILTAILDLIDKLLV